MKRAGSVGNKENGRTKAEKKARHRKDREASANRNQHSQYVTLCVLAGIVILTGCIYFNAVHHDFLNWDDKALVVENNDIKALSIENLRNFFTSFYVDMYHPLTTLSFAIEYMFFGLNPAPFHATNLILHLLNTVLVFKLMMAMTKRHEAATVVALLFAIHPMHVESVAWISERKDLLYTLFYLGSLICYVYYVGRDLAPAYLVWSLLLFLCSLLSKSAAVTLPLLLLLIDYYVNRKDVSRIILEKVPFLILSCFFGILSLWSQQGSFYGSPQAFTILDRFLMANYAVAFYVVKLFVPLRLSAIYPFPSKVSGFLPVMYYLSPLLIAAMIIVSLKVRALRREILFGTLFFLATISLVLHIIPIGSAITADRYTYVPYMGLFFIVGQVSLWIRDHDSSYKPLVKPLLLICFTGYIIAFSIATYSRNEVWRDSITLFSDVIQKVSGSGIAYHNLATAYNDRGLGKLNRQDLKGAVADFDAAIAFEPSRSVPYSNRGTVRAIMGDFTGAVQDFTKAIETNPRDPQLYFNRGLAEFSLNRKPDACSDWQKAVHLGLGQATQQIRQFCDAY